MKERVQPSNKNNEQQRGTTNLKQPMENHVHPTSKHKPRGNTTTAKNGKIKNANQKPQTHKNYKTQ